MLQRPAEHDQPGRGRARAADEGRQRDRSGLPVVGQLRGVLDGVLDQAEPGRPPLVEVGDDVEHQAVEGIAPGRGRGGRPSRRGPGRRDPAGRGLSGRAGNPGQAGPMGSPSRAASLSGRLPGRGTVCRVSLARRCSRTACARQAVATLTYVYADQTAVLGPLATYAEPHAYDLCASHSEGLSAPLRLGRAAARPRPGPPGPTEDDLLALADAVREAGRPMRRCRPRSARPAARSPAVATCEC